MAMPRKNSTPPDTTPAMMIKAAPAILGFAAMVFDPTPLLISGATNQAYSTPIG
jgi:hypothetical protein